MQESAGEIVDRPPLIPPGNYQLKFESWATCIMWGKQAKLIAWFSVTDFGDHFGVRLPRYYNVKRLIGKAGNNGRFKAAWNCDLVREYATLLPMPSRLDRLYLDHLQPLLITGMVNTVTRTAEQEDWPNSLRYSVVRKLLKTA
jgi:hypothetical protein